MTSKQLLLAIVLFIVGINLRSAFVDITVSGTKNAGYGSYGVNSTKFVDDESDYAKVFFMGNSVYYGTEVIPEINSLQDVRPKKFQLGNFGFTGASLYDYIHNYQHIRQFKPDLIVVQFNPTSFGYAGPYYRNDGYKAMLKPNRIKLTKEAFVRETLNKDDMTEQLCHSYLPLVRVSKLDRSIFNMKLRIFCKKFTNLRIWTFFPNKLNAVGEWAANRTKVADDGIDTSDKAIDSHFDPESGPVNKQEYKSAEEALAYFTNQLKADNQKAIFILQPSGFPKLPIMLKMATIFEDDSLIQFADHHDFYVADHYVDQIHPNLEGAKLAAQRHYRLITKVLN